MISAGVWKPGNGGTVVTDERMGGDTLESRDYYGGYLIAESIRNKDDVNMISAAKEMYEALIEIIPHAEIIINDNHPSLRKAKTALLKAKP